jgi:hypothetical protein
MSAPTVNCESSEAMKTIAWEQMHEFLRPGKLGRSVLSPYIILPLAENCVGSGLRGAMLGLRPT